MADYQDVQIARRITRLIQGSSTDFSLINIMISVLMFAVVIVAVASIFR